MLSRGGWQPPDSRRRLAQDPYGQGGRGVLRHRWLALCLRVESFAFGASAGEGVDAEVRDARRRRGQASQALDTTAISIPTTIKLLLFYK